MSPLDTAVYWTEYVFRHGDCAHMKPLAVHQSWWQRRLLDVWLFIFSFILVAIALVVKMFSVAIGLFVFSTKLIKIKTS